MSYSPLPLTIPLAAVLLLLAIPAGMTGFAGRARRLDRAGRLGLHTPAAQLSDEAFVLANRVAAPLVLGAAFVGAVCAVLILALPIGVSGAIVVAVLGFAGLFGQLAAASRLGERAAQTLPRPARKPEGSSCGGCGCGEAGCGGAGCGEAHGRQAAARDAIPDLLPDATTAR